MKKDIHPSNYREVVFKDMSNGDTFITRSTVAARETIDIDGVTYPLVKLEITNTSHPFFTGKQKLVDTAGRVDKFSMAPRVMLISIVTAIASRSKAQSKFLYPQNKTQHEAASQRVPPRVVLLLTVLG